MTDQPYPTPQDDVEAHMPLRHRREDEAPAEKPTGAEPVGADARTDDDVEAHAGKFRFGVEQAPADLEAHMPLRHRREDEMPAEKPTGAEPVGADAGTDDDVEAHAGKFRH